MDHLGLKRALVSMAPKQRVIMASHWFEDALLARSAGGKKF